MISLSRSSASKAIELAAARAAAVAVIRAKSDEVRRKYITSIAGQEMVYLNKEGEAKAYLAASPEPTDLSAFPFIAAEAQATGLSVYEVAQIVLFKSDQWRTIGPMLEALRIGAGRAVDAATTQQAIDAAISDFTQDMELF